MARVTILTSRSFIGLTMPLAESYAVRGRLVGSTSITEATYYNIKTLLLTNWGERPNQPYMGGNLIEFLFMQQTQETRDAIVDRVQQQVSKYIPYVTIKRVNVSFSDQQVIRIGVVYSMNNKISQEEFVDVEVDASMGSPGGMDFAGQV